MDLTNLFRVARQLHDVCYRDPKLCKKVAGRTIGQRPAAGPFKVTSVKCSTIRIRELAEPCEEHEVPAEQVYTVPPEFEDYERRRVVEFEGESTGRPSAGELYEARDVERPKLDHGPKLKRALTIGRHVAYKGEVKRRCRLGQITDIFQAEKRLAVHALAAQSDNRLRVVWMQMSKGPEGVKVGPGDPFLETISFSHVIATVELHQGSHEPRECAEARQSWLADRSGLTRRWIG